MQRCSDTVFCKHLNTLRTPSQMQQQEYKRCHDGLVQVRKHDRRQWCAERMLNFRSLKKAVDIRAQLAQHLKQLKVCSHFAWLLPAARALIVKKQ